MKKILGLKGEDTKHNFTMNKIQRWPTLIFKRLINIKWCMISDTTIYYGKHSFINNGHD